MSVRSSTPCAVASDRLRHHAVHRHDRTVTEEPNVPVGECRRRRSQITAEPVQPAQQPGGVIEQTGPARGVGGIAQPPLTPVQTLAQLRSTEQELDRDRGPSASSGMLGTRLHQVRDIFIGLDRRGRQVVGASQRIARPDHRRDAGARPALAPMTPH